MLKTEERLVVVHNPNSTRARHMGHEVLDALTARGAAYVTFETKSPNAEDNIADMQNFFRIGDRALIAAGDGTGQQAARALLLNGQQSEITVGFLPYGNFNDTARTYGLTATNFLDIVSSPNPLTVEHHPLTVAVNGKDEWDAMAYLTMGWTAKAASEFASPESRAELQTSPEAIKLFRSLLQLGGNYFAHRHEFLPPFYTSKSDIVRTAVTDVLAINNPTVGRVVRFPHQFGTMPEFGYKALDVSSITKNIPYGVLALTGHAPSELTDSVSIHFKEPSTVRLQSDGEFAKLPGVSTLNIRKDPNRFVRVISGKSQI